MFYRKGALTGMLLSRSNVELADFEHGVCVCVCAKDTISSINRPLW